VSFPTVVKQGLLFVWPDENGHELAEKTVPPVTPGMQHAAIDPANPCPSPSRFNRLLVINIIVSDDALYYVHA
jgi:phenylpropionate dioxygenase-like ring-hydroxylating dioxygenase large terminal subunit